MAAGTIFDSVWFRPEKPAFDKIARWSDPALTIGLLILATGLIGVALWPKTPTLLKAVIFAWVILP